ncbi:cytochrome b5 domain-containing protein [Arachnia propionica]|nr:cytochrome b5 domain-containing protein [Arachnia propionica]
MPRWLLISLIIVAVIVVAILVMPRQSHKGDPAKVERTFSAEEQSLIDSRTVTPEELAANDGLDGRPAWIAVNGVVYDVTERWQEGRHHGLSAGRDLTEEFINSGHPGSVLPKMKVVGSFARS